MFCKIKNKTPSQNWIVLKDLQIAPVPPHTKRKSPRKNWVIVKRLDFNGRKVDGTTTRSSGAETYPAKVPANAKARKNGTDARERVKRIEGCERSRESAISKPAVVCVVARTGRFHLSRGDPAALPNVPSADVRLFEQHGTRESPCEFEAGIKVDDERDRLHLHHLISGVVWGVR